MKSFQNFFNWFGIDMRTTCHPIPYASGFPKKYQVWILKEVSQKHAYLFCFLYKQKKPRGKTRSMVLAGIPCQLIYLWCNNSLVYRSDPLNKSEYVPLFSSVTTIQEKGKWAVQKESRVQKRPALFPFFFEKQKWSPRLSTWVRVDIAN